MARVYLADSLGPNGFSKPLVIKVLRSEIAENPGAVDLMLHEARVAAQLNHPNIVQVFDLGQEDGLYFMAMEWIDGLSLGHLIGLLARQQRALRPELGVYIAQQVGEALAYLNAGIDIDGNLRRLVHRDVSPSNVLLSTTGGVKLADFGVVKVLKTPALTEAGLIKGKYPYMSPEQIRGGELGHQSDIFALGIVLFETLTAKRLFHRESIVATIAAAHAANVMPPSSLNEAISEELDRVVLKALKKAPQDRYSDAREFVNDLMPFTTVESRTLLANVVRQAASMSSLMAPAILRSIDTSRPNPTENGLLASTMTGSEARNNLEVLEQEVFASGHVSERPLSYASRQSFSAQPIPFDEVGLVEPNERTDPQTVLAVFLFLLTVSSAAVFWWLVLSQPIQP